MRIPRDISGESLASLLKKYGYEKTRQTGSHIRLTTHMNGKHDITVPNHRDLKIGTLSAILGDVAMHFNKPKEQVVEELF